MLLTLLCILIILLITGYLGTQGTLSAILVFAAALFAGVLAAGTYELFAPMLAGWRPEVAHGTSFLGVFFLAFSILRFVIDGAVPKNVTLPLWVDRIAGGFVGLFAGTLVVGMIMLGVEMLPLSESILGAGAVPEQRDAAPSRVAPAKFASGIVSLACGRAFGGNYLTNTHPDLGMELTGYRHTVEAGSLQAMLPDSYEIRGFFQPSKELSEAISKTEGVQTGSNGQFVVLRTVITKGDSQPKITVDADNKSNYLRISTTQVRLVAEHNGVTAQYYPIGYLEEGKTFRAMPLATGYTVDDFNAKDNVAIHDWVFELEDGSVPVFLELKRGGRKVFESAQVSDMTKLKPYKPLAAADYPPHEYRLAGKVDLTVLPVGSEPKTSVADLRVFVVTPSIAHRQIDGAVRNAAEKVSNNSDDWTNGKNGWGLPAQGKDGVPQESDLNTQSNAGRELRNSGPDDPLLWNRVLPLLLTAQQTTDGKGNVSRVADYFANSVVPLLKQSTNCTEYKSSAEGTLPDLVMPGGSGLIIIVQGPDKTDHKAFRMWMMSVGELKKQEVKKMTTKDAQLFGVVLK